MPLLRRSSPSSSPTGGDRAAATKMRFIRARERESSWSGQRGKDAKLEPAMSHRRPGACTTPLPPPPLFWPARGDEDGRGPPHHKGRRHRMTRIHGNRGSRRARGGPSPSVAGRERLTIFSPAPHRVCRL